MGMVAVTITVTNIDEDGAVTLSSRGACGWHRANRRRDRPRRRRHRRELAVGEVLGRGPAGPTSPPRMPTPRWTLM